ncbi:MAG: hypothetical protein ACJ790_06395 [Myxococcaceae bacterium]
MAASGFTVLLALALRLGFVPKELFALVLVLTGFFGAVLVRAWSRVFRPSDAAFWAFVWKRDYIRAVRGQRLLGLVGCVVCSVALIGAGMAARERLYSALGCAAAITFTLFFATVVWTTPRGPEAGRINPAGVVVKYPWGELLVNWRLVHSIHPVRPPNYLPMIAVILQPGMAALEALGASAERSEAGFRPWARELDRNIRTFGVRLILRFANEAEFEQALQAAESYGPPVRAAPSDAA